MMFRIVETYIPWPSALYNVKMPLTFIWGTDSPVSMASSTMQRPLRSSTSQGTTFSWGERPVMYRIHIINTN